jgi:hypothetical protein
VTASEISLARAYLAASAQDPIAALIWAVKDLARLCRLSEIAGANQIDCSPMDDAASPYSHSIVPGGLEVTS